MTSPRSPVGVVVIAMVSLFAIGCTAQTSAVFEALIDPPRAPASPSEADAAGDAQDDETDAWWTHPDGYGMALPAGWSALSVTPAQSDQFIDAVAASHPDLAARLEGVLDATQSRLSMVAADATAEADVPLMVLVLSQPTDGRNKRYVKTRTYEQIAALPGLREAIIPESASLSSAAVVRFDYTVDDPDLGALRVRSYLLPRFGGQAYLVSFVAGEATFGDAEATFDSIAQSLSFGV